MRYDVAMGVRELILKMFHIQSKLKAHEIVISENYIVHHALNVLLVEYSQIKAAYSAQNETWSFNALITKCVTEEEKLKNEKYESTNLTANAKLSSSRSKWKPKGSNAHGPKKVQDYKKMGTMGEMEIRILSVFTIRSRVTREPIATSSKLG
ncbi:hypothetical protein EUGRSUZ_J02102 [Eucalyptus grandis]|uniref:Uncharacterized protein n=2 Tax=Eucalyptus grandis TaxID=71139 RepID=A0ACC3J8U3_EUCGR|nr:hypothetical protein EUGRSUZ_J02102 [Eucalyptus grandis]